MNYQTFQPHPDLSAVVKCYWTLQIPAQAEFQRQLVLPDGCIDMIFILGADIKRYTSENDFILQPRAMVLGQITGPFYVEPTGFVDSFAVRFYPYGFAGFVQTPIHQLAGKETPLAMLFGNEISDALALDLIQAHDTSERIQRLQEFLFRQLQGKAAIDHIVKTTIDAILASKGGAPVNATAADDLSKRRKLERKFIKQIGISPKQLGRVIRLQSALRMLLNRQEESLTAIAYENDYYDQSHFIKDFKEFTGTTPGRFPDDAKMALSSLFYRKDG